MREPQAVPDMTGVYRERWSGDRYSVVWNRFSHEWEARQIGGKHRLYAIAAKDFVQFSQRNGWEKEDAGTSTQVHSPTEGVLPSHQEASTEE